MQPMAYSTPADNSIVTEAQTPTRFFRNRYFFAFFAFTIYGEKRKKKYHSLIKEPFSAEGGFIVPSPLLPPFFERRG